jgi:hypothetical protein
VENELKYWKMRNVPTGEVEPGKTNSALVKCKKTIICADPQKKHDLKKTHHESKRRQGGE